ncbi:MAG: AtpZ/AtpI family protein [Sulfurovum sp.]|nr:AtpZ/AtpI family protein [Sulfurovum sp.]
MNENDPKFKKIVDAADGLSLGISMVVAVLIGVGIGYLLRKWFGYDWLFWLGVFWGISAAVFNIYKAYAKQKKSLDELADDPRYKRRVFDDDEDDD